MKHDTNRIEVVDPQLPEAEQVVWAGTLDDFQLANADWPLDDEELDRLASDGRVTVGGGAAGLFVVRCALAEVDA